MSTLRRTDSDSSDSSIDKSHNDSGSSVSTRSTAPSECNDRPIASRGDTWPSSKAVRYDEDGPSYVEYIEQAPVDDEICDDRSYFDHRADEPHFFDTDAIPASEHIFKALFPSTRQRLDIRHDDSTSDGNMNVRIDTMVASGRNQEQKTTLFHLRMHDLKTRAFSLRRYCRDSQKEVCSTSRKTKLQQNASRPNFTRSLSNLVHKGLTSKSDLKTKSVRGLERQVSSGLDADASDEEDSDAGDHSHKSSAKVNIADLSNTMTLQFMDYSHVDISRQGSGSNVHYGFEYWDAKYSWRRLSQTKFDLNVTSFHLVKSVKGGKDIVVAHITPKHDGEAQRDREAGGWIHPSDFWLLDEKMSPAVADKVIATGLMALVDDTIRTVYHAKETPHSDIISSKFNPRRILGNAFRNEARPISA